MGKLARINAQLRAATAAAHDDHGLAPLLAQHEAVIERGLKSFVEVGEALAAIRDGRLYRASHPNFDAYLADRWPELGHRNYVGKLIRAAHVAVELGTTVPNAAPAAEWQVRPLLKLKTPDARLDAWQRAGERAILGGRAAPTARDVEAAVMETRDARRRTAAEAFVRAHIVQCRTCGVRMPAEQYGGAPPVHCTQHGLHYAADSGCPACAQEVPDASKGKALDALANRLVLDVGHAHQRLEHLAQQLDAVSFADLWPFIPMDQQLALADRLAALHSVASVIEDLIGEQTAPNT
jgi:hypothetical protein